MRLAALTATSEDVDELSKAFNMGRPLPESINQPVPPAWAEPVPLAQPRHGDIRNTEPPARLVMKLLMAIFVLMILLGIVLYFVS